MELTNHMEHCKTTTQDDYIHMLRQQAEGPAKGLKQKTHPESDLKWPAVAGFAEQLIHNFRNYLYGIGLEVSLLSETVTDEESRESVERLKSHLNDATEMLKDISHKFSETTPTLKLVPAADLLRAFQQEAQHIERLPNIIWNQKHTPGSVRLDMSLLTLAARELLGNAAKFGSGQPITVTLKLEGSHAVLELCQQTRTPVTTSNWGDAPFAEHTNRGYGLGLWYVRKIAEAHGGKITHVFDAATGELHSTLGFPVIPPAE